MNFLLPKNTTRKNILVYSISIPIGIIVYLILFLIGYIMKPQIDQILYIIIISLLDALIIWALLRGFGVIPKVVVIILTIILGFIVSIIYIEIAHEHAMWKICYPAIQERLGDQPSTATDLISKDGSVKSWYQHLECEDNLLPFPWRKQAKFSDNPPGFIPKEASSKSQPK